jgi:hypothetical protein
MHAFALAVLAGLLLLISTPASSQTPLQRPDAPVVTAGANLKELIFDWERPARAMKYRVLHKTHERMYFEPLGPRIPGWRPRAAVAIAVHLQNWDETRYIMLACNLAGCTRSAEIDPRPLMLDTIGYFKASNTGTNDGFGREMVMSVDGTTLAVAAERESSNASGVNGNQADNSSPNSGAVYVYRRTGREWAQEAYLKAGVNQPQQSFGRGFPVDHRPLAISGDGSLLAVGAPGHNGSFVREGVVYLYSRGADGAWTLSSTLRAPVPRANDHFGLSVDMAQDGRTLKVNTLLPAAGAGVPQTRAHIYVRPAETWQHSVTLAPYYSGDQCQTVRLSGDGRTLFSSCLSAVTGEARGITQRLMGNAWVNVGEIPIAGYLSHQPMAINHAGDKLAVRGGDGWVWMYRWENGAWVNDVRIGYPSYITLPDSVGWAYALEFDRHGNYLAIGDYGGSASGAGVSRNLIDGSERRGAVYLYQYMDDLPNWFMRTAVQAPNPQADDQFGRSVALSGDGNILAVGAVGEDSAARGLDGNQNSESASGSGAVYLY